MRSRRVALTIVLLGGCSFAALALAAEEDQKAFRPLFDGKSLDGWHVVGGGTWNVEDGVIVGTNVRSEPRHGHLVTDQQYGDFTVRCVYKAVQGNSGLYFRIATTKGNVGVRGFQAEIDATKDAGGLYETGGRGWVVQPRADDVKKYFKPGEWNEMTVTAQGKKVVVHVNGTKTAQLENDPGRLTGFIAFQVHGGQDVEVRIKEIKISGKPIDESE